MMAAESAARTKGGVSKGASEGRARWARELGAGKKTPSPSPKHTGAIVLQDGNVELNDKLGIAFEADGRRENVDHVSRELALFVVLGARKKAAPSNVVAQGYLCKEAGSRARLLPTHGDGSTPLEAGKGSKFEFALDTAERGELSRADVVARAIATWRAYSEKAGGLRISS